MGPESELFIRVFLLFAKENPPLLLDYFVLRLPAVVLGNEVLLQSETEESLGY